MSKIFLSICILFVFLSLSAPLLATAQLVQCDGINVKCDQQQLIQTLQRVLSFIVLDIATPLGVLALIIGGILMLISAGNPGLSTLGKTLIKGAIIGLLLAYCTDIIINFVLQAIGASGYSVSL
jgi:hypothetical protein